MSTHTTAITKTTGQIIRPPMTKTCARCVATSEGKPSCCVEGGSWYRRCGDPGDLLEHTWTEGLEACKGKFLFVNGVELVTTMTISLSIAKCLSMHLRQPKSQGSQYICQSRRHVTSVSPLVMANPLAALTAVAGTRNVEIPSTERSTRGQRGSRRAKVSK